MDWGLILGKKLSLVSLGVVISIAISGCSNITPPPTPETCATSFLERPKSCPLTTKVFNTLSGMGHSDLEPTSAMNAVVALCNDFWGEWNGRVGVPDGYFDGKLRKTNGDPVTLTSNQAWYWLTFAIDSSEGVCLSGDTQPINAENELSF
jgi:hypothetical protein